MALAVPDELGVLGLDRLGLRLGVSVGLGVPDRLGELLGLAVML